jgi:hypothetical protein
MSSSAATAVARLPFASPEPCVAVATAPATEMCGSDAVAERHALGPQHLGQLAVPHGRAARHGRRRAVDDHVGRERADADELGGVGERVEGVARAEHAHARRAR